MKFVSVFFLFFLIICPFTGKSQSPSAFPAEITFSYIPQPVMVSGQSRLLYELRITNFGAKTIRIEKLDVTGEGTAQLATYKGEEMEKLLVAVGPTDSVGTVRMIGGGRSVIAFVDLTLKPGEQVPPAIHHLFSLSIAGKDGKII